MNWRVWLLVILLFMPLVSLAADCNNPQSVLESIQCLGGADGVAKPGSGLYQGTSAGALLKTVTLWLLSLVAILALVALIIGGIMYIISLGDEGRAETAKRIILYAIVGVIIVGTSFTIIQILEKFLSSP